MTFRYTYLLVLLPVILSFSCDAVSLSKSRNNAEFVIGVGIADVTGPAAGIGMMGYANPSQVTSGIHTRLYSRAFVIADYTNTAVFVTVDCGMISQIVKIRVISRLEEIFGDIFGNDNVLLSGTHSHSGPGGYLQYLLFTVTNLGFYKDTLDNFVEGIVKSIERAYSDLKPGHIYYGMKELLDANINRSPTAYYNNPEEEIKQYEHDTDKEMHLLKFEDIYGNIIGVLSWFAVHPVSMNNTNTLISSDNVGLASLLLEKALNPTALPGKGPIVAAFASSNLGDSSPNVNGARCQDTNKECDLHTSTCNGKPTLCVATGPGKDMFESTWIIGNRLFNKAWEILNDEEELEQLSGAVKFVHQFVDMSNVEMTVKVNGKEKLVKTCKPAMGYSFAAGTTDGPGAAHFQQGTTNGGFFWNAARNMIRRPSEELTKCQKPKPILLATGEMTLPQMWQPEIVDLQVVQIGEFSILGVPGEFTTMAGRRLRKSFKQTLEQYCDKYTDIKVVIAGLSNVYSDYITTYEEYQVQRYEGGSTIYGPFTLDAYIHKFKQLAISLATDAPLDEGPSPPDLTKNLLSFILPVWFDKPPYSHKFGDCVQQPYRLAYVGETIEVRFVAGHPRNHHSLEESFLTVERLDEADSTWKVIATDANWDTKFIWKRTSALLGESEAVIQWTIPNDVKTPGYFRISHFGTSKSLLGKRSSYQGTSSTFEVSDAPDHMVSFWERNPDEKKSPHVNRS